MIFNLISKAKDLFINRDKTGVAADNVEDAISVLNSNLSYKGSYTGNIDELHELDKCGGYFVQVSNASGTQPFDSQYYYLEVPIESGGRLQRATQYITGETKERYYTNGKWYPWSSKLEELNNNLVELDNNIKGFKVYTFSLPASSSITLQGKGAYLLVVYHNGYANGNLHYYGFVTLLKSATSIITELRKGSNINVTGGSAGSLTIENTSDDGAAGVRIYSLASSTDITQV